MGTERYPVLRQPSCGLQIRLQIKICVLESSLYLLFRIVSISLFFLLFCYSAYGYILFGTFGASLCFLGTLGSDLKLVEVRSMSNSHMTSLSVLFGGILSVEN